MHNLCILIRMKILKKIVLVAAFLYPICLYAEVTETQAVQKTDSVLLDAYHKGIFSGTVVISHHEKEIYYTSLGYADWETKQNFTRKTAFDIGSLNKQFTEEIIHQLVKEKKLSYSDKLNSFLNLFQQKDGDKITIQHLLDMKAGLGDYLQNDHFRKIQFEDFTLSQLVTIIQQEGLLYEPGTKQLYSNSGYVVLGALIEKITGISYEQNLFDRITKPLGLENFNYSKTEKQSNRFRATGTDITVTGTKISRDLLSNSTPAGGIYTSCEDLLKFTEAKLIRSLPSKYAYRSATFAGGSPLWNSAISYQIESGYAVVVMANTGGIAEKLIASINSILQGEPIKAVELPFTFVLNNILQEKGIGYIQTNVELLANKAGLPYDARFLNYFGYQFLNAGETSKAIELFKANTELFPTNGNCFDSLGEAYLKLGDKKNALTYYKIALKLNPENQQAKNVCTQLEAEK